MAIPTYILAGGHSKRFGSDKARHQVDDTPLLKIAAAPPRALDWPVKVVARKKGAYDDLGFETLGDVQRERGPLGGLYTALCDAKPSPWVCVLSCDLVGVQPAWLTALAEAAEDGVDAVLFDTEPYQPLCALYSPGLREAIKAQMHEGNLALQYLLENVIKRVIPPPEDWDTAKNINSPDALP